MMGRVRHGDVSPRFGWLVALDEPKNPSGNVDRTKERDFFVLVPTDALFRFLDLYQSRERNPGLAAFLGKQE